ncbi:hypothetical protein PISMIDRAFT_502987 [Pisolithus microcarpus 441]|uniref:G domain-containing protein n=1 Tax=Pisolithus microcarpus 441 TaxID=765257 RepID=A0A0C9YU02_9AGAM|nr:hypothetical protein PISMIDRAFT_502987 [Pisolithus microcarpus 441]
MPVTQHLRISYIELRSAKDVEYIEVLFHGCRRSIRRQDKNHFREEFPEPLTVQGEALSFSVHWKRWYSFCIPVVNNVRINVRDVLSDSRSHKFQTERSKLDITIGLSSDGPSVDGLPAQGGSTPTNTNSLRPTTEGLLNQCPRFRILVIGQSGVGKSTLIHRAFGIGKASADNLKPGAANVEEELISPQNDRFVLHDSNGFEPADHVNCDAVKSFIADRKSREPVKEKLHAVWLCFRIPIESHGDRLLEDGAETFLQRDTSVLQNIPTMVVFTKYDKLLTYMAMKREVNPTVAAEQYLQKHCIGPIAKFAGDTDLSYVAVSSNVGLEQGYRELIDLTHRKVTERFRLQTDTPSPVSVVTLMAQRIIPELKIRGSIDVGKQRYWRTLTSGANFKDHTITECLAVIHTDIVRVWNFNDPSQYLYRDEFRKLMADLAGTIDGSTPAPPRLARADTTGSVCKPGPPLLLLAPLILPFEAGLGLAQWALQTYQQLPNVHHKFMAYIVDLVHILEILFSLTAGDDEKKLTRGAVSSAFNAYYDSEMRYNVHRRIKGFDYKIPGRDTVLEEIISLVRTSPIDDNDISSALRKIPLESLAKDDEWLSNANSQNLKA